MTVHLEKVTVTTTGSAGSAAGIGKTGPINGRLVWMYLDWSASAPATSDLTITDTASGVTIWTLANSVTDVARLAPRLTAVAYDNTAITNSYAEYAITGGLTFTIAQCDALAEALVAWVWWED